MIIVLARLHVDVTSLLSFTSLAQELLLRFRSYESCISLTNFVLMDMDCWMLLFFYYYFELFYYTLRSILTSHKPPSIPHTLFSVVSSLLGFFSQCP